MQNNRFVILTGHLNDYPLSDLVGILRHQHKTGRLLIEYEKGPATFFFYEGNLVDAKLNDLTGMQAVCFALGQPPASFNFNPLIQPSQQTIEDSLQRTVSELLGCWDEHNVDITVEAIDVPLLQETTDEPAPAPSQKTFSVYDTVPLALPPAVTASSRRPASLLVMTIAGLATLGVSTAIALSGGFRNHSGDAPATAVERPAKSETSNDSAAGAPAALGNNVDGGSTRSRARATNETSQQTSRSSTSQKSVTSKAASPKTIESEATPKLQPESVTVVMEIENGRVLRASIASPKPGMDSYEAMALRIARQRRYSTQQSGRETVKIKVSAPSDQ